MDARSRRAGMIRSMVTLTLATSMPIGAAVAQTPFAEAPADASSSPPPIQPGRTEDRVVITAMVPVPNVGNGAPYRALGDLATMKSGAAGQRLESTRHIQQYRTCRQKAAFDQIRLSYAFPSMEGLLEKEVELAVRVAALAGEAEEATRAAEESRRKAADGLADMKDVEAAELKRQDAINKLDETKVKFLEAGAAIADFQELERRGQPASPNGQFTDDDDTIAWGDLDLRASQRRKAGWWDGIPAPDIPKDLAIGGIEAHRLEDKKGAFVRVTGEIRNSGSKAVAAPELVVSAIDARGWVVEATPLSGRSSLKIPAGGSRPFAYELRPVPGAASKISVSFGSKIAPPSRLAIASPDC